MLKPSGEPGAATTAVMPAKDIVKLMVDKMTNSSFFQLKVWSVWPGLPVRVSCMYFFWRPEVFNSSFSS
jgi:hypothetical protein